MTPDKPELTELTAADIDVLAEMSDKMYSDEESDRLAEHEATLAHEFSKYEDDRKKWFDDLANISDADAFIDHILATPGLAPSYLIDFAKKSRDGDNRSIERKDISRVKRRIIEARAEIAEQTPCEIDYIHSVLCHVGLPRSRVKTLTFERRSGAASLLIEAGKLWSNGAFQQQPLPFGTKPRLALIHVCSEAVRTQSPAVEIGGTVKSFLERLGLSTGGSVHNAFLEQIRALAACRMTIGFGRRTIDAKPFKEFDAWLSRDENQETMWPGRLTLSNDFFSSLQEHSVPLDPRSLCALSHSALAMDIYFWLAHRLYRANPDVYLPWSALRDQFGQEYGVAKDFRSAFLKALVCVKQVYPQARVERHEGGMLLRESPPPVPRPSSSPRRIASP